MKAYAFWSSISLAGWLGFIDLENISYLSSQHWSKIFDPVIGAHTNGIDGYCGACKRVVSLRQWSAKQIWFYLVRRMLLFNEKEKELKKIFELATKIWFNR